MFKYINFVTIILLLSLFLISCGGNEGKNPLIVQDNPTKIERGYDDQYIVVLKSENRGIQSIINIDDVARNILSANNINPENLIATYKTVLRGFAAKLTPEEVNKLNTDSRVLYIEPDKLVSLPDPYLESITDSKSDQVQTQTTPWGITAVGGAIDGTTLTTKAYIIDTGIDLDHPDLNVETSRCTTFVRSGRDARNADDGNGHGSHVAGTIAAKNNTIGVIGVAAGAKVIAVKVLNSNGSGTTSQVISGVDYAAGNGSSGDVVNISLGGGASTSLDNAVISCAGRGLYVAVAAGNSSANANYYSPARANGTRVYTISAHNSSNVFASFSNYGNPPIDYSAPGVSVYSTYRNGGYATMSGTSMSTPHVCGILLATGGTINSRGTVTGDRDSNPDRLANR